MRGPVHAAGAVLVCALFATSVPAAADEIENVKTLQVDVQGSIAQQCTLGELPNLNLGDLSTASATHTSTVSLNCNIPIEVRVRAANGGLQNREYPHGQGPYAGSLPYDLSLTIPVRAPEESVISERFHAVDLIAGRSFSSNGAIAVDGMELRLDLGRPGGDAGLLGGDYSEVVEITIVPT